VLIVIRAKLVNKSGLYSLLLSHLVGINKGGISVLDLGFIKESEVIRPVIVPSDGRITVSSRHL
jgi:hypothetical protein